MAWLLLASWRSCGTRPSLLIGRLGCMLRLQKAGQEEGWIGRGGWIPGVEASRLPVAVAVSMCTFTLWKRGGNRGEGDMTASPATARAGGAHL